MTRKIIGYSALAILLPLWAYVAFWLWKLDLNEPTIYPLQDQTVTRNYVTKENQLIKDVDSTYLTGQKVKAKKSTWYTAKQDLYANLLAQGKYDVIVMPATPQANPLDQIGRSLITRELVWHLREAAGLRVPDPELLEIAFGENQREQPFYKAIQLARKTGAQTVISLYVGYTEPGTLRVSADLYKEAPVGPNGELPPLGEPLYTLNGTWESDFSHERLPYEASEEIAPKIVKGFEFKSRGEIKQKENRKHARLNLPKSPSDLYFEGNTDPLTAAYHLQLLGALYPDSVGRARERLYERSLLALNFVSPKSADYPLLKARALFHLHRRPAALIALGEPKSHAERALHSLMQGNLPQLTKEVKAIEGELDRLLALIELRDLEETYDAPEHLSLEAVSLDTPIWREYIDRRLADKDEWNVPNTTAIKQRLDNFFPYESLDTQELVKGKLASTGRAPAEHEFVDWTIEHTREILRTRSDQFCCKHPQWVPSSLDWLNWFESRAEFNAAKQIEHEIALQARHQRALSLYSKVAHLFDGNPQFAALTAQTRMKLLDNASPSARRDLIRDAFEEATHAMIWRGGQSDSVYRATEVLKTISQLRDIDPDTVAADYHSRVIYHRKLYSMDFPQRYQFSDEHFMPAKPGQFEDRSWEYAHDTPSNLYSKAARIARAESKEAAETFLKQNANRFAGHPNLVDQIAEYKTAVGDTSGLSALYANAITAKSEEWTPYWEVGKQYLEAGNYKDASKTFLKYPFFSKPSGQDQVYLSNLAYDVGTGLFWRGATSEARPFYELSAGYQTGSEAGIRSAFELAILDQDFRKAAEIIAARAARYPNSDSYREYVGLLHTLGFSQQASAAFDLVAQQLADPTIWDAAWIGNRLAGKSSKQLAEWIRQRANHAAKHPQRDLLGRYAVMGFLIDRSPDESVIELIEELGSAYRAIVSSYGTTSIKVGSKNVHVGPANFVPKEEWIRDVNVKPKTELGYFAQGYFALISGNFDSAYRSFKNQGQFYAYYVENAELYALPYLVWAGVKSGNGPEVEKIVQYYDRLDFGSYERKLSHAFLTAGKNDHETAAGQLESAFNSRSPTGMRPISTWYQLVEAAEWLYEDSGYERYRELALIWAKSFQRMRPMYAWAYAVEAKLIKDPERRKRALAFLVHLDRRSRRLQEFSDEEREAAKENFKKINPFRLEGINTTSGGA